MHADHHSNNSNSLSISTNPVRNTAEAQTGTSDPESEQTPHGTGEKQPKLLYLFQINLEQNGALKEV